MTQMSVAELIRTKRRLVDDAVRFATQSKWHEAEAKNREILEVDINDQEAWNRLGKALLELGRYKEAHEAYLATLERDKGNVIAFLYRSKGFSAGDMMSNESGCVSASCVISGVDWTVNSSVTPGFAFSYAALIGSIRSTPRPTTRRLPW